MGFSERDPRIIDAKRKGLIPPAPKPVGKPAPVPDMTATLPEQPMEGL